MLWVCSFNLINRGVLTMAKKAKKKTAKKATKKKATKKKAAKKK